MKEKNKKDEYTFKNFNNIHVHRKHNEREQIAILDYLNMKDEIQNKIKSKGMRPNEVILENFCSGGYEAENQKLILEVSLNIRDLLIELLNQKNT